MSDHRAVPAALLGLHYRAKDDPEHVESWFAKANAPDGQRAIWIRCTVFARPSLPPVAEAWAIAFDRHRGPVAMKSTVPYGTARFGTNEVDVEVDGCTMTTRHGRGSLASGRGSLAWDLAFGPSLAAPIVHFPSPLLYRDGVPPFSKLVSPISDARAEGSVTVDRTGGDVETWDVDGWPMMMGHNWGRGNAELYAWTHCNAWEIDGAKTEGFAFEAMSARVRVGPLLSPMATSAYVRWKGRSWDLSRMKALGRNRGTISLRRWEMTGDDGGLHVACEVAAETDDIVGLHYPNPSGTMTYCLNTKLARARIELKLPDGEKIIAVSRAAALELGTTDGDHGVRMVL